MATVEETETPVQEMSPDPEELKKNPAIVKGSFYIMTCA